MLPGGLTPYSDKRGKGPKNYRRSDASIAEDIYFALTLAPDIDATEIEMEVHQGVVTLKGKVHSGRERRQSEEIVEGISGVREVINLIESTTGLIYPYKWHWI